MTVFAQPTRFLWVWLREAIYRYNCGRRFGHFRAYDEFGFHQCSRCGCPMP